MSSLPARGLHQAPETITRLDPENIVLCAPPAPAPVVSSGPVLPFGIIQLPVRPKRGQPVRLPDDFRLFSGAFGAPGPCVDVGNRWRDPYARYDANISSPCCPVLVRNPPPSLHTPVRSQAPTTVLYVFPCSAMSTACEIRNAFFLVGG